MSYVQRGVGCACNGGCASGSGAGNSMGVAALGMGDLIPGAFPVPMNPILAGRALAGLRGLGLTMSWNDPSQSSANGFFGNGGDNATVNIPGTAANALATATPDGGTPIGTAVVNSFSNNYGGAQPGVLPLSPNDTANNLSFAQPAVQSLQCQLTNAISGNPLMFLGIVFGVFYMANMGAHKAREYRARKKAAA